MTDSEDGGVLPFHSSWIDHLTRWIDRLPVPSWVFYVFGILGTAAIISAALWIDGSVPFGTYGSIQGVFPPFVFYFLALYQYLTQAGTAALGRFRPMLDASEAEVTRIEYELANLPRWIGRAAVIAGLVTLPPYLTNNQLAFGDRVPRTALPYVVALLGAGFFGATFVAVIVRSIRQLRQVHELHARATNVSLLSLEPAHAFSRLTAITAVGMILVVLLGYLYDPSAVNSSWIVFSYSLISSLAVVIFVVPVIGIRERLENEKRMKLNETNELLAASMDRLHEQVRSENDLQVKVARDAVEALIREREFLSKISTWPWDTRTIGTFASTLLLPIFLWLVTRLLGRIV